jgi:carbonic anhydrase/acetyltransferase-like protein (isoleucine patch superfamily)
VRSPGQFNFFYRHPAEELRRYIQFEAGQAPRGLLIDFVEQRKEDFQRLFEKVNLERVKVPDSASLDRFALIKPKMVIGENVLVAQRAYLENTTMGKGANAQENCYIINSSLKGNNVTAHGGKIIEADLEPNVFVGFNSFLRGRPDHRISIGKDCVIMPHTIIDSEQAITIPAGHLLWGFNTNQTDIENNSVSLEKLAQVRDCLNIGAMHFEGDGGAFVSGFQGRIHHILETNGAFFDGSANSGHAQKNQNISFNTIQPYPDGERTGLYPTIVIQP